MNILVTNPYRVLGVFSNISESELLKQKTRHARFLSVGKSDTATTDFRFLGPITRTVEMVEEAMKAIEQPNEKLLYSLMWFINLTPSDGIAFENLRNGNVDKAKEIWGLACQAKEISAKNFSACLNLSSILIAEAFTQIENSPETIEESTLLLDLGLELKGRLFNSEGIALIADIVVDGSLDGKSSSLSVAQNDETASKFAEFLYTFAKPLFTSKWGPSDFCKALENLSPEAAFSFQNRLTEDPIIRIKEMISKSETQVKANVRKALASAKELFDSSNPVLSDLEKILGKESSTAHNMRNNIANQILNCAIGFFNKFHEDPDVDPGKDTVAMFELAEAMQPTGEIAQRLRENKPTIFEWMVANESILKIKTELKVIDQVVKRGARSSTCSEVLSAAQEVFSVIHPVKNLRDVPKDSISLLCDRGFAPLVMRAIELLNELQSDIEMLSNKLPESWFAPNQRTIITEMRLELGLDEMRRDRVSKKLSEFNLGGFSIMASELRQLLKSLISDFKRESIEARKILKLAMKCNPSPAFEKHLQNNLEILGKSIKFADTTLGQIITWLVIGAFILLPLLFLLSR